MGAHRVYREHKYAFGHQLLTVRTWVALTQIELAEQIGMHRRSVQKWETGESYPKAETLQRLIAVLVRHQAFKAGQEREEAEALWNQAAEDGPHPLPAFDEVWFARTLALHTAAPVPVDRELEHAHGSVPAPAVQPDIPRAIIDWGEAIAVSTLHGREGELQTLQQWLVEDRCRVVAIVGMGGIGKSSLAITVARSVLSQFDVVVFRSLQNGPPLAEVLDQTIRAVSNQQATPPDLVPNKIAQLVQLFRERRCLLILDNFESLIQPAALTGTYRTGYAEYGALLSALSERAHQSCLLLTSREKPSELGLREGRTAPVRTLQLSGLDDRACQSILVAKDISGTAPDMSALARLYGGNPLALNLAAEPIRELFGGDVSAFLTAGDAFFNGVDRLLDQQLSRLSTIEQDVLNWLAIGREPVGITELRSRSALTAGPREWLEAIEALRRRYLIERGEAGAVFTLQPVVMEYVTTQLIGRMLEEIVACTPETMRRYAVLLAQAPEYVRQSQERVLVQPLLAQLGNSLKIKQTVEAHLAQVLGAVRVLPRVEQGYGGGNVLNLLVQLGCDLRGHDFSDLNVWQANLANAELPEVNFHGADLTGSRFSEAFKTIVPVAFSPDGRYLAAGSIDGEIWLWRVADNQQVELFQGHTGPVNTVAFSPDNRILASGSSDGLIMLWSLANGARLATLSGHSSRVWSVAFDPNGALLASGSDDQTIKLWSVTTGTCLATLAEHSAAVASVAFSPDGALLASGSHDPNPTIKCWDVASGACVATLVGHTADIWSVAFSPDGSLLASGSADLTIRLWSVGTGTHSATLRGHTARIRSVAWSSDGATLASGSLDQTVKVWDIAALQLRAGQAVINADAVSGVCRATLAENTGPVNGVAFSPDGDTLAGGGELQTIALWSVARKECLALLYGYNSGVLALAFSPDGATLASAGFDRTIRLWSAARRMPLARLAGHTGAIYSLAFSPDGTLLVSGSGGNDRSIRLWSVARTTCLASLVEHRSPVVAVAWSSDAYTIASGSLDRTIRLWSPTSATSLATLSAHSDAVRALAFSPDGRLLASASYDRTVRLWAVAGREPTQTFIGHTAPVRMVTFSPDGSLVASGSADQTIRLWSVASGVCQAILSEHNGEVVSLAFSVDGALLASGSFDGTVRLWDVSTARQAGAGSSLATLNPQAGVIYALAFSRDGRTFASGGADGLITLWDLPTRQAIATLRGEQPYAGMNITAATGLTDAQRATLRALGAVDRMGAAPAGSAEHTPAIGSATEPAPAGTAERTPAIGSPAYPAPVGTAERTPAGSAGAADRADDAPRPSGDPTVVLGLPFQPTSFIGRSAELAAIARLLADPACRLLTLLGPGGIGKTRLAQAVAATHNTAFADGVAFVALAAVETPNQIVSMIGAALSLSFAEQPNPTAHLLGYLRERHMLLVLDNFEHLLADIDLVAALVTHAPQVTILVTSRERLNLQTEWLFDVEGLAYPPEDQPESATAQRLADPTSYGAVQLFVQRARQVQPELALSESTLTTIVRICQHIAGMPLAIELAAASLRTLPLAEIERQVRANLDILATTRRDVPARHRSMRAMFDHSWRLLSEAERALFSHVAVFRGGWTVDAAQQVAEATLPALTALVDKSLVRLSDRQTQPGAAAEARFVMLEPLREYALEQLAARGEAEALRRAHANYYLALATEAAAQWYTPTVDAWIAKLHRESDNMRAALQWARDSGNYFVGLQLAGALWKFWQGYGYTSEGRSWLDQLLTLEDPHPDATTLVARLSGLQAAAWLASEQHHDAQATRLLEQSMLLRRALRETTSQTNPLVNAARQARTEGQYQRATAALEDALSRYSELRERIHQGSVDLGLELFDLGQVLRVLGVVRREQGDFAQATALLEESLTMYRRFGEREGVAFSLAGLADVARDQGDAARVREYGAESVSILRELRIQWMLGFALNNLAQGAYVEGDLAQAFTLIDESVTLFRDLKAYSSLAEVLITQGHILRAQGHAAAANAALSEALRLAWAVGPRLFVAAALEGLASVVVAQGRAELAARLLAAASALRAQMGTPVRPVDHAAVEQVRATARSALGNDAFATAWAQAQALPLEQILSTIPSAASFAALGDRSRR